MRVDIGMIASVFESNANDLDKIYVNGNLVAVAIVNDYIAVVMNNLAISANINDPVDLGELLNDLSNDDSEVARAALRLLVPYTVSIFFSLIEPINQ